MSNNDYFLTANVVDRWLRERHSIEAGAAIERLNTVPFTYNGCRCTVMYRPPHRLSPEKLMPIDGYGLSRIEVIHLLLRHAAGWDVEGEIAGPPITCAVLQGIPEDFLRLLLFVITADIHVRQTGKE